MADTDRRLKSNIALSKCHLVECWATCQLTTTDCLLPHLQQVELPLRKRLETRRKVIEHIYFPESGFISVVADGHAGQHVEVGLIGREGMSYLWCWERIVRRMTPLSSMSGLV